MIRFYGAASDRTMRPEVSYSDLRNAPGNTGNVEENKSSTVVTSVESSDNYETGKNNYLPSTNILCPATPGRYMTDKDGDGDPPTQDEVRDTRHKGGRTPEEGVEEDILPIPGQSQQGVEKEEDTRPCVHDRAGTCTLHGPGATKYWMPVPRKVRGPDGTRGKMTTRKSYFVCADSPRGRGKLRQTRISAYIKKKTPREEGE